LNTYGISAGAEVIAAAVNNGQLSKTALQLAAKNVLKFVMKSNQNIKRQIYAGIQTIYMDKTSKFEAEAFNRKSVDAGNVGFETYSGGVVPTNTNNGKVFYYALDVELGGKYRITPRVSAMTTEGSLSFAVDEGEVVTSENFIITGDWHRYQDQSAVDVFLPGGNCELAITCNGANFNMDYFTVEPLELTKTVTVVQRPADIAADYLTPFAQLPLPETVNVTLSDGSQTAVGVEWNEESYYPLRDGKQTIHGTIVLPDGVANYMNLLAYATLQIAANPNPVTKVRITNKPTSIEQGATYTFEASVEGVGDFNTDVDWSVDSYYSTISKEGVLTVSEEEMNNHIVVTAASVTDPTIKNSVTVTIIKAKEKISATKPTRLFGIDFDNGSSTYSKEDCLDITGGKNLQDFNNSDWIEFECVVEGTGTYDVVFRYASPVHEQASLKLLCDNQLLTESEKLANTGGWQNWKDSNPHRISLTAGNHVIRVQANGLNFNFNYVEFTPVDVVVPEKYTLSGKISGTKTPQQLNVTLTQGTLKWQATPDAEGNFSIEDLYAGTYVLTVKGSSIHTVVRVVVLPVSESLEITVMEKGTSKPDEPSDIDPDSIVYGDVNNDGEVDATDALYILKAAVGKQSLTEEQKTASNVNGDTKIDAVDALLVLQLAVGKIDKFPIQK
jgi:hypothetical protein